MGINIGCPYFVVSEYMPDTAFDQKMHRDLITAGFEFESDLNLQRERLQKSFILFIYQWNSLH